MRTIHRLFFMIIFHFLILIPLSYAQIYTFDYLNYADKNPESSFPLKKWNLTKYLFLGLDEFDENGNTGQSKTVYTEWHLFISYLIYNGNNIRINSTIQSSAIFAEYTLIGGWFTPWFCAKIKCIPCIPLWLRMGYQFGKLGTDPWVEDNKFDTGLLYMKSFGTVVLESTISYRIRSPFDPALVNPKPESIHPCFNQYGDEIHYKLEIIRKLSTDKHLSLLVLGYYGGNKEYQSEIIPDTEAYKTALGASLDFHRNSGKTVTLSFLCDLWGRFDKRGFSIIFNVTH